MSSSSRLQRLASAMGDVLGLSADVEQDENPIDYKAKAIRLATDKRARKQMRKRDYFQRIPDFHGRLLDEDASQFQFFSAFIRVHLRLNSITHDESELTLA